MAKKGLFFLGLEEHPDLGKEFVSSPEEFAKRFNLTDLACPPAAHEALARGKSLASDIEKMAIKPDTSSMSQLKDVVAKHFGDTYDVSLIPFGLKFREKANLSGDITASGTATITFADSDADVDG
jgi:hypothetical protein